MSNFLFDPVIIVTFVVGVIGIIVWLRFRHAGETDRLDERTTIFVFPRTGGYMEIKARTYDGLVIYDIGGMVEDTKCVLPMFYGRAGFFEAKNPNAARERVNTYLTRPGDAAPMNARNQDMTPDKVSRERFEAFSNISIEREINRGKLDAAKSLFSERLIAIGAFIAIIMGVITWSLVVILPLTPIPPKSLELTNPQPTVQPTIIPGGPDNILPTPFVPTNYRKILH